MSKTPPRLTSPREVAAYLKEKGMSPLKKFGQNFLCDENILHKIADAACPEGACVLEIGMGLGALTHVLAARASRLVTVEIDRGLIRAQREDIGLPDNAVLVEGDILETDLEAAAASFGDQPFYVCGNLPYYITGRILMLLLESLLPIQAITAMVQKEVADRLAARPGDSDYGALTALAGYYSAPETLFTVSSSCFYPAPDVDSAIIRIDLAHPAVTAVPFADYRRIVNAAFAMRRKTIQNNLRSIFGPETASVLESCGIRAAARAQELTPEQFACLAERERQK
ncbi:MAG: ribosomal RNA small subunit methyltransferase A [Clostridia bacterium]|nr:ribosomal RNA small subunit methyltransferase A [Clostridia bacterium]